MSTPLIVKSRLICHKCKSKDLFLTELWNDASIQWEQIDGIFDRNDGCQSEGNPYCIECQCKKCKHRWRVRSAMQIDEIISD